MQVPAIAVVESEGVAIHLYLSHDVELFFRLDLHNWDVKLLEVDFKELVLTKHVLSELSLVLSRVCPLDVVLEDNFELFLFILVHEAEAEEVDV